MQHSHLSNAIHNWHQDAGVANLQQIGRLPTTESLQGCQLTSRRPSSSRFRVQASPQRRATSSASKLLLQDAGSGAELLPFASCAGCSLRLLLAVGDCAVSTAGLLPFVERCSAGCAPLSVLSGCCAGGAAAACPDTKRSLSAALALRPGRVCASELMAQLQRTLDVASETCSRNKDLAAETFQLQSGHHEIPADDEVTGSQLNVKLMLLENLLTMASRRCSRHTASAAA